MSAGEFFDYIRPAVMVLSAFVSTWVLVSARRRFSFWSSLAWALGTLSLPLLVLPLYVATTWFQKPKVGKNAERVHLLITVGLPLVYAIVVLLAIAGYLYDDYTRVDAYLARATQARVKGERDRAITEYRVALSKEDNAHTHKLLAIELSNAGDRTSALQEFRRAETNGEPDESISYRIAELLSSLNQPAEAQLEYQRFLNSRACTQDLPDVRCESARSRVYGK